MYSSLKTKNNEFISRWFPFYKSEIKPLVLVWSVIVFLTFVNIAIWNLLQTTVIKQTGLSTLPWLYAGSSVFIFIGSILLDKFQKKLGVLKASVALSIFGFFGLVAASFFTTSESHVWWYIVIGLLVNSAMIGSVFTGIFNIIHDVLTPNQNKRWIPWTGTAGTVAGILSGFFLDYGSYYISSFVMHVIMTVLMGATAILIWKWKNIWPLLSAKTNEETKESAVAPISEAYKTIKNTTFLWTLALTLLLSMLFTRIFNFTFAITADATYTNEADLVSFFGRYTMYFYIASLFFSTNIAQRLVKKFGLTGGMYLPIIIVGMGTTGTLFWPGLISVSINMFFRDLIVGFQSALITLLMAGIPNRLHSALWVVFDGHIGTVGGIIGAGILWVFQEGFSAWTVTEQIYALSGTALILLIIRLWLTHNTRRSYLATIEKNIMEGDVESRTRALESFTERKFLPSYSLRIVLDLLKNPIEPLPVRIKAAEIIGQLHDPSTLRVLKNLLNNPEKQLRISVIKALSEFDFEKLPFSEAGLSRQATIEALEEIISKTPSATEFSEIIQTLGALGDPNLVNKIRERAKDPREEYQEALLKALGKLKDPSIIDYSKPFLSHSSPRIVKAALGALWQFVWERENLMDTIEKVHTKWKLSDILDLYYILNIGEYEELLQAWKKGDYEDKKYATRLAWTLGTKEAADWTRELLSKNDKDLFVMLSDEKIKEHMIPKQSHELDSIIREYKETFETK